VARSKALPCILKYNMESRSFPFSFDIGRANAEHLYLDFIRYEEQGLKIVVGIIAVSYTKTISSYFSKENKENDKNSVDDISIKKMVCC